MMLPLVVQTFLGGTPPWAGVMLSPGGLASVVAMMIAGLAMGRLDVRYVVAAGFLAQIYSSWLLTSVNLQSGMGFLIYAWCFRGLGLGFVFVPIATAAMRRIPPEAMGVAAGFFNLLRNEGGSVGIAVAATLLQTRSQFHHARLAEHMTPYNPVLQEGAHRLHAALGFASGQDPATAGLMTQGLLAGEVLRQSYVMAFVDVFAFLVLVYVICLPFVLLLKDPGHGELHIH